MKGATIRRVRSRAALVRHKQGIEAMAQMRDQFLDERIAQIKAGAERTRQDLDSARLVFPPHAVIPVRPWTEKPWPPAWVKKMLHPRN